MMTVNELIQRMSPTALAETIVSLEADRPSMVIAEIDHTLRTVLKCNVGDEVAEDMIEAARN